ncbi:MAG: phosphoglucomutase [Cyanobacteria bacterium J06642_2]
MTSIQFGTDGWRGLLDRDLNDTTVARVAQAFADYWLEQASAPNDLAIAIAYDGRRRSQEFAQLFAQVLRGNEIRVVLSDRVVPTPVLSCAVKARCLNAGVMVTASHNPAAYNGIKFKANYGGPFFTEQTRAVECLLGQTQPKISDRPIQSANLLAEYLDHLKQLVNLECIGQAQLHVVVDSMGGAGQTILADLLVPYGCRVETIDGVASPDFYQRSAEPIEKNLAPLMQRLQTDDRFSLGLATDGDGDRLGVVLDGGEWLSAQETILLLADYVVNQKSLAGDLVKTSSVTDRLAAIAARAGRNIYDVQVGFKYICEEMIARPIVFGCEESGGYGFGNHLPERDGIVSALMLLELLATSGMARLSNLVRLQRQNLGEIFYDRVDLPCQSERYRELLPFLANQGVQQIAAFPVTRAAEFHSSRNIINGLKFTLEGNPRWLLLRASETEPMLRIYAEGRSLNEVAALLTAGRELLQTCEHRLDSLKA